jgi:hypothetical protein
MLGFVQAAALHLFDPGIVGTGGVVGSFEQCDLRPELDMVGGRRNTVEVVLPVEGPNQLLAAASRRTSPR